jgi:hypothetical protein
VDALAKEQFLTTKDLMNRWQCCYLSAYYAMHSKIMKATKPKGKLLASLKNVEKYEEAYLVNK